MPQQRIENAVGEARAFFDAGKTLPLCYRLQALKRLDMAIAERKEAILTALKDDLHKSFYEGFMTELGLVQGEIRLALRRLRRWARPRRARPALGQLPAVARVHKQPYGVVLIMSPWNYPFQLSLMPLIGAVAAGNCVLLKPSKDAPKTAKIIQELCRAAFEEGHVAVIQGGRAENTALLEQRFDYLFFTGSAAVGRVVMAAAARHLTPLTLELGGKSPAIVDETADARLAARRILFGKLLNAGQTCVATDYVLVHQNAKAGLVYALKEELARMLPNPDYIHLHYPHIVNDNHFERLQGLLLGQNILASGIAEPGTRLMAPVLVDEPAPDSPLMQEEIFGPILPIISYANLEEALAFVSARPRPLALYLFTNSREAERRVLSTLSYGGGCVNDTVLQVAGAHLPFGGVGESGLGRYHGQATFDTFSHHKSVLHKGRWPDLRLRHHPYKKPGRPLPGWLMKL